MSKRYDPEAELKKVGVKVRKEQKASTEKFIKELEKEPDAKKSRDSA